MKNFKYSINTMKISCFFICILCFFLFFHLDSAKGKSALLTLQDIQEFKTFFSSLKEFSNQLKDEENQTLIKNEESASRFFISGKKYNTSKYPNLS